MQIPANVERCYRSGMSLNGIRNVLKLSARDLKRYYGELDIRGAYRADDKRDARKSVLNVAERETRLKKACTNPSYEVIERSDGDGVPRVEYVPELAESVVTDGRDDTPRPSLVGGRHAI